MSQFPAQSGVGGSVAASQPPSAWSPEQLVRLQYEWRQLQRSFAYHPYVRVVPLEGEPPTEYRIEYPIRTLAIHGDGQLDYLPRCSVQVRLPGDFPHGAPVVTPLEAIFHPNVDSESIQIIPAWTPADTLADLVVRVGMLLSFQSYDPYNVWNPVAMDWVTTNADYVPTDPNAKFEPETGGDPLDRICRGGAATLASLRDQMQKFCESLLEPKGAPSAADARYFAMRTRMAVSTFLANDVPEHLSGPASALDEWAIEVPRALVMFDALAKLKAAAAVARGAAGELVDAAGALGRQLAALEAMVRDAPSTDPRQAMRQLPAAQVLQRAQGELRGVLARAEHRFNAAEAHVRSLDLPQDGRAHCAPLEDVFARARESLRSAADDARQRITSATDQAAPLIHRAQQEVAALERIRLWREYTDMLDRARPLVEQVERWGSAGAQAYFVSNPAGEHGPFEFEQELELGSAKLAVRSAGRRAIEVMDAKGGLPLGRSENGELKISLPGDEPGETFATVFRLTARCDDLTVQLDYLIAQTRGVLQRIGAGPVASPSWCGRYIDALAEPGAWAAVLAEHEALSARWQNLAADLDALAPLKERTATYHLLIRGGETVPRFHRERAEAEARRDNANLRIADILARSSRDVETDQTIIPGKLLKEYASMIEQRDSAAADIERLERAVAILTSQVRARLESEWMTGSALVPRFAALAELPEDRLALANEMNDAVLAAKVAALSRELNVPLSVKFPPTPVRAGWSVEVVAVAAPGPEEDASDQVGWRASPEA